MPRDGAKLDAATIRDFEAWIARGAFDPREQPATKEDVARETSFDAILRRRKTWWSFQPLAMPPVPDAPGVPHPVDRFLLARLPAAGLRPAPEADPRVFVRRCHLLLVGLPPTPEDVEAFVVDHGRNSQAAVETLVDRLLASPRFGERWARHWMDVMRYAETHGSEGDPTIPHARRYRDYLIRAFNADVPYGQFVREQIAGDLIRTPRVASGVNESALGIGHLRMVLHGFSPTDSLDELVTFTDNQIDTVTKAFLGLTVSCARCHDHKFDAISQADFTSLYGIFASTRPAVIDVNTPERQTLHVDRIGALKNELRPALAARWLGAVEEAVRKLRDWTPDPKKPVNDGPLAAWARLSKKTPDQWAGEWKNLQEQDADRSRRLEAFRAQPTVVRLDLKSWSGDGAGLVQGASPAGEFTLHPDGDLAVSAIHPAGVLSHRTTDKHRAMLTSPRFKSEGGRIWVRLRGDKARARYVVQNYPRTGTIHFKTDVSSDTDTWISWSLEYWAGDRMHLEISTQADPPLEGVERGRSWFGASEVLYARDPKIAPPPGLPSLSRLGEAADLDALAERYREALKRAIEEWRDGTLDDDGADFLSALLRFLPNKAADLPLVAEYRRLEKEIPEPSRAPGVLEGFGSDEPLFVRGDHKRPAQLVPRRFLEAIDPAPYTIAPGGSGRLELAASLSDPSNPFFARVIVNRLWQHLFGRGLVATPDNFGRLGEPPTHPELLDHLARRFLDQNGSMKSMIRYLARLAGVPARLPAGPRGGEGGPGESPAVALLRAPAGGRGDPRRHGDAQRHHRPRRGRGRPATLGLPQGRPQQPGSLPHGVRLPDPVGVPRPPRLHQRAGAVARPDERPRRGPVGGGVVPAPRRARTRRGRRPPVPGSLRPRPHDSGAGARAGSRRGRRAEEPRPRAAQHEGVHLCALTAAPDGRRWACSPAASAWSPSGTSSRRKARSRRAFPRRRKPSSSATCRAACRRWTRSTRSPPSTSSRASRCPSPCSAPSSTRTAPCSPRIGPSETAGRADCPSATSSPKSAPARTISA
jgi:hypothetical protein